MPRKNTENERLARIEQVLVEFNRRFIEGVATRDQQFAQLNARLDKHEATTQELRDAMNRGRGAIAVLVAAGGIVGGIITFAAGKLWP
jgi:hypothetical protein